MSGRPFHLLSSGARSVAVPEIGTSQRRVETQSELSYSYDMPVIVIGADTPLGELILDGLLPRESEVRAFVTDIDTGLELRKRGAKVAIGDLSDGSHVGGAAMRAFCAIVVASAASDDRERSFADSPLEVFQQWREGLVDSGVKRVVWVDENPPPPFILDTAPETVHVDVSTRTPQEVATEVARLEDAKTV